MPPNHLFRAAILEKTGSPLLVERIKADTSLSPGQVLVKILYSGICGAQINEIDAAKGPDRFLPHLLGHEGLAEVLEVGPLVRHVAAGDRVVLHWMQGAGMQSEPPSYKWGSKSVSAGWVTTLSELAIVSENRCTPINSTLPETTLPLFGCAATTSAGVVGREAAVRLGESAVVLGAGGVGLLTIMAAKASGAYPIIAVDIWESRLRAAEYAGASKVLDASSNSDLAGEIRNELGGSPDVIVEASGARAMIELAYNLAQPSGRAILVGVPNVNEPASIETLPLHFGMVFTGSKGGSTKPELDIPQLIKMAEIGLYPVQDIPVTVYPLSEVNEAFTALRGGEAGRMVIECGS